MGHAKNIFWTNPKKQTKTKQNKKTQKGVLPSPLCPIKDAQTPLSFSSLPSLKGRPGWHPQCGNNNFALLHLRLNDCLSCTRLSYTTPEL